MGGGVCIHCIQVFRLKTKYLLRSAFNIFLNGMFLFTHVDIAYGLFFAVV